MVVAVVGLWWPYNADAKRALDATRSFVCSSTTAPLHQSTDLRLLQHCHARSDSGFKSTPKRLASGVSTNKRAASVVSLPICKQAKFSWLLVVVVERIAVTANCCLLVVVRRLLPMANKSRLKSACVASLGARRCSRLFGQVLQRNDERELGPLFSRLSCQRN